MNVISAPRPDPTLCRVALLVDGENLSANHANAIQARAATLGHLLIRRVYGKLDDLKAKGWSATPGFRVVAATTAKNSADLLVSIDAMELALEGRADCIAIAACDSDYTHVALKLRERGFPVYALLPDGPKCADLRAACWGVLTLDAPRLPPLRDPPADPAATTVARIVEILRAQSPSMDLLIPALNVEIRKLAPFKITDTAERTWLKFLAARPDLFQIDGDGATARVRLKS